MDKADIITVGASRPLNQAKKSATKSGTGRRAKNNLNRAPRVSIHAGTDDLLEIYRNFVQLRPQVEAKLPVWIPDPVVKTTITGRTSTTGRKQTCQQVARSRIKFMLSSPQIASAWSELSKSSKRKVLSVIKLCQLVDMSEPESKNELFPWVNGRTQPKPQTKRETLQPPQPYQTTANWTIRGDCL